jgi:glyoxalase family protein
MPKLLSLHHVTATVEQAQPDLDFYVGLLGLRLVKRTVNFDNHHVYHFYYGNELGTPGTIMTTFPYAGMGVWVGRKGSGQVTATAFSVPLDSLDAWRRRLEQAGVDVVSEATRMGQPVIGFADPSSLVIELVGADDGRAPWTGGSVDPAIAIRGLYGVTLSIARPDDSVAFLVDLLGATPLGTEGARQRLGIGGSNP